MAITYHAGRRIQGLAATGFNLTGLKAYWKMNEASGNLINQATTVGSTDSLGTAADSTTVANLTYSQTGKVGNAISWNGTTSSSYAEVGTSSLYDFMHSATAIWSFNFWYKKTAGSTSFRTILANNAGGAGATGTRIAFYNGSFYQNIIISNAVSIITDTSTAVPNDTNWHMITMTVDLTLGSNDYNCYVDGVLETTVSQGAAGTANNAQRTMRIGDDGGGDGNHYGLLDEMSIWSRVLTSAEITSLYNTGSGKEVTELTSKPTNVQVGSRFEETDTRKIYHYGGFATTSGFAQTWGKDPSSSQFEVSGGKINFLDNTSSTGDRTWLDLESIIGSAVSTTQWVLRFKFNFSTLTSGDYYYEFDTGLSDTTVNNITNQNFIGVRVLPNDQRNLWRPRTCNGSSNPRSGSTANLTQSFTTGVDYYAEIKRTSSSNWSISLSTTDAYDGDLQNNSYTDASGATGLKYFKFGDAVTNSYSGFTMQGVCDVLEFYNGVTDPANMSNTWKEEGT